MMGKVRSDDYDWDTDETDGPSRTVYEPENPVRYTGILDKYGNELVATNHREPIGFKLVAGKGPKKGTRRPRPR